MSAIRGRTGNAVTDRLGGSAAASRAQSPEAIQHRIAARRGEEPTRAELQEQARAQGMMYWYKKSKSELMNELGL